MYLLDTNIVIYLMKNKYPNLTNKILSLSNSELCISAITLLELEYGAAKSCWKQQSRNRLNMFLAPFKILPFDDDDAINAGRIRAYLEQKGTIIGVYDIQIAAQGVSKGLTVVTHNTSEFSRVPGIKLEDWVI